MKKKLLAVVALLMMVLSTSAMAKTVKLWYGQDKKKKL